MNRNDPVCVRNTSPIVMPTSSQQQPRRRSLHQQAASATTEATRRLICGGLAGMIAKTATNPLERIKLLSQTGEHGGNTTIVGMYRDILRHEGLKGLWAGNAANLLRVFPAKAVIFSSNDLYLSLLQKLTSSSSSSGAAAMSFVAGGLAGMTASAATYPLDLARGRISGKMGKEGTKKAYSGIVQTIVLTGKEEGILSLYRGMMPTLFGAMPYEGIKFGTVGVLEKIFPNRDDKPSPLRKMLFGGMGGVLAGFILYPNDTVRRLLQLQGSQGTTSTYHGYWDCARQIYQQGGIPRFYRGLTINIVRMAPNAAIQFGSYELLKTTTASWQF